MHILLEKNLLKTYVILMIVILIYFLMEVILEDGV